MNPDSETSPPETTLSGKWVVVGMGLFGIVMTATVWMYWKLHLAPFLPLQEALAEKYVGCRPVVEGGQSKMHKHTPIILRVTMLVDYDPTKEPERVDELFAEVLALAQEKLPLENYEEFELNVYLPKPETELSPIRATRTKSLREP